MCKSSLKMIPYGGDVTVSQVIAGRWAIGLTVGCQVTITGFTAPKASDSSDSGTRFKRPSESCFCVTFPARTYFAFFICPRIVLMLCSGDS